MSTRNIFLIEEYKNLWKDFSVEPRAHFRTPTPSIQKTFKVIFVGDEEISDGKSSELLDKIISAMNLNKNEICILPVSKTDLNPLKKQLEVSKPKVCVALGNVATAVLTGSKSGIAALRGRFHPLEWDPSIPVMPTYNPGFLIRNPSSKKNVWDDMKLVLNRLENPL